MKLYTTVNPDSVEGRDLFPMRKKCAILFNRSIAILFNGRYLFKNGILFNLPHIRTNPPTAITVSQ